MHHYAKIRLLFIVSTFEPGESEIKEFLDAFVRSTHPQLKGMRVKDLEMVAQNLFVQNYRSEDSSNFYRDLLEAASLSNMSNFSPMKSRRSFIALNNILSK